MAAVAVQIRGVLYDLLARTSRQVLLQGEASLLGLEIGGGPVIPPEGGGGSPGDPPGIWGGPIDPSPGHPLPQPPGLWPNPGRPAHPIVLPPEQVPPEMQPPSPPEPGTVTPVPPPQGSQGWPVQPQAVPAYVVLNYPGIGPVYVSAPPMAVPAR